MKADYRQLANQIVQTYQFSKKKQLYIISIIEKSIMSQNMKLKQQQQ